MSFLWPFVRPLIYVIGFLITYVLRRGSLTPDWNSIIIQ